MSLRAFEVLGHALAGPADLPLETWVFIYGVALVLIISFVGLAIGWDRTVFQEDRWRPVRSSISRLLVNPVTETLCALLSVFLLGVTIWSGLNGTEAPDRNFALTFVFVTFWLGLVLLSVLFGDVFKPLNPWRAIGRATGGVFRLVAGQSAPAPFAYPERLGRWPAVVGLFAFVWLELVWGAGGFQTVGLTPHTVAVATLVYSAYTFVAMALFGTEKWIERGETFSVYFGMFASLAPLEVRDGKLGVRRVLSGATRWVSMPGSIALVLLTIGATTFDGASEGTLSGAIETVHGWFTDIGLSPIDAFRVTNTLFFLIVVGFVAAVFYGGIYGMHLVRSDLDDHRRSFTTAKLADLFAHAFIPIALAYLIAHYFSLFVFLEQAQFTFLLSDPLGDGSNFFGTADSGIDYSVLSANAIWYVQVGSLAVGHAIALALGHDRALRIYGDTRLATRSQYWMLALMITFTTLGLVLLSDANQ